VLSGSIDFYKPENHAALAGQADMQNAGTIRNLFAAPDRSKAVGPGDKIKTTG